MRLLVLLLISTSGCSVSSLDDLKGESVAGPDGGGGIKTSPDASSDNDAGGWACLPKTCKSESANCGQLADGCNGVVECGECPTGKFCGGAGPNQCGDGPCTPKTCADLGAACGTVSDGCSGSLDCGNCTAPHVCNSSNQCVCVPETCDSLGMDCGQAPNGCGGNVDCGGCPTNYACTGGKCTCTPKTCASVGWSCGVLDDGCGGQVSCGTCSGYNTCVNHTCVLGAGMSCGACPAGFYAKFQVSNNVCAFQQYCGQFFSNFCVANGATDFSGCGAQCPSGFHFAFSVEQCGCIGTPFVNVCLLD